MYMYNYMYVVQVHLEFIKVCMMRLQRIYEGLQQYQPGEIEQEPQEVQQGYNTEVAGSGLWVGFDIPSCPLSDMIQYM